MSPFLIYGMATAALVGVGLYGLIVRAHLVRKILALNFIGSGVFLLLGAAAARDPAGTDPVPHAMVITGIVVAVSATALALTLASRICAATGATWLPEVDRASGPQR